MNDPVQKAKMRIFWGLVIFLVLVFGIAAL